MLCVPIKINPVSALCLMLHQLWNTNAWWKMISIRKRNSIWALAGSTYIHVQGLPRREGWEVLGNPWLVRAVTAGNSHCTQFWEAHTVWTQHTSAQAGQEVWGEAEPRFSPRSGLSWQEGGWKGTESHTQGTLVTAAVPSCGVSM